MLSDDPILAEVNLFLSQQCGGLGVLSRALFEGASDATVAREDVDERFSAVALSFGVEVDGQRRPTNVLDQGARIDAPEVTQRVGFGVGAILGADPGLVSQGVLDGLEDGRNLGLEDRQGARGELRVGFVGSLNNGALARRLSAVRVGLGLNLQTLVAGRARPSEGRERFTRAYAIAVGVDSAPMSLPATAPGDFGRGRAASRRPAKQRSDGREHWSPHP